jgi:hypothetical protein
MSSSPKDRQDRRAELRPVTVLEQPRASTRGGSRLTGHGTRRRAVLPVG